MKILAKFSTGVEGIVKRKNKFMENKLYKWQKTGLWFAGILYFLTIIYYGDLRKESINLFQILVHVASIIITLIVFWLLFKIGNWIYLKIKNK